MIFFEGLKQQLGFILKVLIVSTVLSYLIKYGGLNSSISAARSYVLSIVVLPSLFMAIALMTRYLLVAKKL